MISFNGRQFEKDIILQCVRWYLAYALSYRDLEEMMIERGIPVDHSTIQPWVVNYSPRLEKEGSKAFTADKKFLILLSPFSKSSIEALAKLRKSSLLSFQNTI